MVLKQFIALWATSALVVAKTPEGFVPASNADLIVAYGQTAAMNGVVVDKAATTSAPTIAAKSRLSGTSYAVMMVDLDIPSDQNPHTFLHWLQTDLTPATAPSTIPASNGTLQAFTLFNPKNTTAIVPYTPPAPPAQNPLSHRYTQILVDTSSMTLAALSTLRSAAQSRVGFDAASVLRAAGLSNNVVAGNSFNVTNPGQTLSSASASTVSNFTASSIGDGAGDTRGSGQIAQPDSDSGGGFKGFGLATEGGTLTTTISSAPAGPTGGLTKAGTINGATSMASDKFGWDADRLCTLILTAVATVAFLS